MYKPAFVVTVINTAHSHERWTEGVYVWALCNLYLVYKMK